MAPKIKSTVEKFAKGLNKKMCVCRTAAVVLYNYKPDQKLGILTKMKFIGSKGARN
jgi:hypothetical protein